MFKKSQAALEFLTTYAWAFLVILIMIGALAYFGILRPADILPDRCNFGSEITCIDYVIDATNNKFTIKLKNSVGESIVIPDIYDSTAPFDPLAQGMALSAESSTALECALNKITDATGDTTPVPDGHDYIWGTGETADFEFTTCNLDTVGFRPGNKDKIFITITYYSSKSGATYEHEVKGEVYASVT